jgi:hypothetical protein
MMSLLHAHKIENYEWDGQAGGGYCGSAIGLVELMRAFRGLSTNRDSRREARSLCSFVGEALVLETNTSVHGAVSIAA